MRFISVIGVIAGANVAKAAYCTQEDFADLTGIITMAIMNQSANTFTSESGFVSAVKGDTGSYSTYVCASCFDAYISAMYPLYGNPKPCITTSTGVACLTGLRNALTTVSTCATGEDISTTGGTTGDNTGGTTGGTTGGSKSGSVAPGAVIAASAAIIAALAL